MESFFLGIMVVGIFLFFRKMQQASEYNGREGDSDADRVLFDDREHGEIRTEASIQEDSDKQGPDRV